MDLTGHRNLYNGDWGTCFWSPNIWQPEGGPYTAKVMHRFVDLLADSGVDTFLISPATQVAWYPSKVMPRAWDGYTRGDPRWRQWLPGVPDRINLIMMDHYLDLVEAGVDWLAEVVDACRRRGVSPWLSIRMNDLHGAGDPVGNPINCPLFHDPRYRLKGTAPNPREEVRSQWQGLNYECVEVRDYMFAMIRELVVDYGLEGLELDFLRNPNFCEPDAPAKVIDTMTDWVASLRALTQEKARATGRPCALGLRIPGQLEMLRQIGLDVRAIVRSGLVDFVGYSNFMETSWDMPHDELRAELGSGIAHYGVIEHILTGVSGYAPARGKPGNRLPAASAPALRGNAAGKLVLGVDGIEQYNYFAADEDDADRICTRETMVADYTAIRDVHSLEYLRGKPKHYCLPTMFPPGWYPPIDMPEALPTVLEPQWRRAFRLPMCAEPVDLGLELTVQLVVEKSDTLPDIGVDLNGAWPSFAHRATTELVFPNAGMTHHLPTNQALDYQFPVASIREGWNVITICNESNRRESAEDRAANSVTIVGVELAVKERIGSGEKVIR
jgi:hypothetical protein